MHVPREILSLINSDNINLYKTCNQFYSYVDIFYKSYEVDYNKIGNVCNNTVCNILIIKSGINEMSSYIHENIYMVRNVKDTDNLKHMSNITKLTFDEFNQYYFCSSVKLFN